MSSIKFELFGSWVAKKHSLKVFSFNWKEIVYTAHAAEAGVPAKKGLRQKSNRPLPGGQLKNGGNYAVDAQKNSEEDC